MPGHLDQVFVEDPRELLVELLRVVAVVHTAQTVDFSASTLRRTGRSACIPGRK